MATSSRYRELLPLTAVTRRASFFCGIFVTQFECDHAAQENLLFSSNGEKCGAHDFQYCGAGLGAKDIAYLFCSGLSAELLPCHEEELLAHYHTELTGLLLTRGLGGSYTMEVLREHFGFALIDFVRFMDGWGYWGNKRWATRKVEQTLLSVADKLPRTNELFKRRPEDTS
jgi:hypothetical protein